MSIWMVLLFGFAAAQDVFEATSAIVRRLDVVAVSPDVSVKVRIQASPGQQILVKAPSGSQWRVSEREHRLELARSGEVEITGPPRDLQVVAALIQGRASGWDAPLSFAAREAQLVVDGGRGSLRVDALQGSSVVQRREGKVEVEGADLQTQVTDGEGALAWTGRSGKVEVLRRRGDMELRGYRSAISVRESQGAVRFLTQQGPVDLVKHHGRVKGESSDGAVTASVVEMVDFRVTTKDGRVTLSLPEGLGASVLAESRDADVITPKALQVKRDEDMRVARGELPGASKGVIAIRTENALIRIKN